MSALRAACAGARLRSAHPVPVLLGVPVKPGSWSPVESGPFARAQLLSGLLEPLDRGLGAHLPQGRHQFP